MSLAVALPDLPTDHSTCANQSSFVGGHLLDPGHTGGATQCGTAGVDFALPTDQGQSDTHRTCVGGQHLDPSHSTLEPHFHSAGVDPSPLPDPNEVPVPKVGLGRVAESLLLIYSDALDDLERTRIATENRVRSLRQVKGMEDSAEEQRLAGLVDALAALEHGAELEIKRALRKHPLGPWVNRTVGVGEKQGARLIAAIGDPYWNSLHDRPRTVSELWAYCGYHVIRPGQGHSDTHAGSAGADPSSDLGHMIPDSQVHRAGVAPSRKRGQKANWNATAKMRAFLVAEACMKQRHSPYRAVYDDGRAKYAEATHGVECRRCGPAGRPAQPGSPLSDGHKHARALRLVAKAVLRDLWVEAKALREVGA